MIRNLGQVAAIYIGSSQPTNTNLIWLDNTVVPYAFRAYDGSTWSELATRDWVKMFVDGWLVSLPPSTQAGDTDYLLINSNNVNYKITVKEFVKSAVGNPLDFKGVIRTDADFPNPANCEAGDMYVIITSPAGGTVTDPYSGQMFEDTEKIVWDEVTKSWESLGKIQITVDLSTDYSATNVTINSSAGKGTTINAASTSLAGVMLPQQVKFLTYLSNGSTVPGDPSELDPDTPAHKHNYGDILDRLISQQETGDSTFHPMSQKATTDNLDLKFDKANVVQVQGASTVMVMSQKAVTDAITTLDEWIKNELTKYLPLSGGDMTGDITLGNSVYILGDNTSGRSLRIAGVNANNQVVIGSLEAPTYILSNSSDLIHSRNNVSYKILDSYNLPDPATLSGDNTWTGTNTFNGITNINNSFVLANSKALQGRNVAGTLNYAIGQVNANNNVEVGDTRVPLMLVSNDSNLIHYRGTTSYGIWDAYNLPDPAAKSADNVFTGTNSFTAGQFNVGPFEVTNLGSLSINMSNSNPWERYLIWSNNSAVTSRIMFGGYGNGDTANYAWIGIGDVNYTNAQYIFAPTNMQVPLVWSLDDTAGNSLVWAQSTQLAHFGRAIGTTKIRSGNVDLIHTKGATDYKILDSYNLPDPATLSGDNTWTGTNTFNGITNINNSFVLANSKALQGRNVAGTLNYAIGQVNANNNVEVGDTRVPLMLVSNDSNLIHYRGTTSYGIWDAYNLPDPAAKSADNVFTGTNSFTAGQFNVGPFEVTNLGSLSINMSNSNPWERYLIWSNNSAVTSRIMFGGYGNGDTANYAWIGIGDVNYTNAQYIFAPTNMQVPLVWSLDDTAGNSLVWAQSTQLAHFGRAIGTTKIRSGNVDLIHTKGATDYKILDESNYSQYLPTNNKWTYGFVTTYIEGSNADFNTLFAGPDSPKIVFNYYRPIGNNTNAPTGMSYGAVLQIDGNYNSGYNSVVLRPQLAFDVNHNVENGTRYMWFRTANNLGFGDSSNWKRVVTADENVAALSYDENTYPTIMRIDGTTYDWLRVPNQGLLPNTKATLDSGGTSYLGTNDWSFGYASIHTIYSKRYMFGNTGVDFRLDTNNKIAATISGSARGIEIGDLLVSSNYGEDAAKVPTNGIFASGIIKSYSGFSSDSRINNLNISKASNDALHISSFAEENVINKPGVDPVSGQSVGDGVALTYFWAGDYAFQLVGDIDGTGMAYRKYTPSTGNSTDWKFLADTKWVNTKLGGYLPLTGGILTGKLTINTSTVNPLAINDTNASATEVYIQIQRAGTALAAIGNMLSNGSYIYNYATDKYLFVGNDGCYFGTPSSNTKLLTSADLSGYLPLSGGTMTGAITLTINQLLRYTYNSENYTAISVTKDNPGYISLGNYASGMRTFLLSNDSDILHYRSTDKVNGTPYRMWDEYNLPSPVKSTSTKKVTDIQVVDALPATQVSGVLYLVFG